MVMRCDSGHVVAYELYDNAGHSLGTILMPRDETIVGAAGAHRAPSERTSAGPPPDVRGRWGTPCQGRVIRDGRPG